jgi:flagellar basal body-associated protein FliL
MSKASSQDNFVAYVAATVVVALAAIFIFTWSQVRNVNQIKPTVAYAKFGPYQVETQNYSLTVSLAVQTSIADSDWANDNRQLLNVILKKILANIDIQAAKAPNGLQSVQDALRQGCNAGMSTNIVQAVLLTNFVFQAQDS